MIFMTIILISSSFVSGYNTIPENLLYCYRGNETKPWVGFSLQSFIELIRKIEDNHPNSMEMRILSANLIHRLRVDGIEKAPGILESDLVTPYGVNGIMASKFKILLQLVSSTPGVVNFEEFLSKAEICHLHKMLSSSVDPYQRGDERLTCPITLLSKGSNFEGQKSIQISRKNTKIVSRPVSRCPIENGVVRSFEYGTISPGTVIASIAAGLQPQNVKISEFVSAYKKKRLYENLETMDDLDTKKDLEKLLNSLESMDNMYSANLAGDLAEVCIYQGPYFGSNLTVGLTGTWNNSYFPRVRHFSESHDNRWEMTDSEILAGLDGLFLSQQTLSLVNRLGRLRLSQTLDMYYSARGIPIMSIENTRKNFKNKDRKSNQEIEDRPPRSVFENSEEESSHFKSNRLSAKDEINRACHRKGILEMVDAEKLKRETYNLAQVLQFTTSSVVVSDETMKINCDHAVDKFLDYARILLDTLPACGEIFVNDAKPNVDLTLVIDGWRDKFWNQQIIHHIAEITEISKYGSQLSVVHGDSGEYLINKTNMVTNAFEQLRNFTGPYPQTLSLSTSLGNILLKLSDQIQNEQNDSVTGGNSLVILIFSQEQKIMQNDFNNAKRLLETSYRQLPDLYFIFVTDDPDTFKQLTKFEDYKNVEEHYHIIETCDKDPARFTKELSAILKKIPKRITPPFCKTGNKIRDLSVREEFEEYLSPGIELGYRISPLFLHNSDEVQIQFQSVAYGEFTVCSSRNRTMTEQSCKSTGDTDNLWFNFTMPCNDILTCPGIYFTVSLDKTFIKCSENDCRFPDQVRFLIKQEGLRCQHDDSNGSLANILSLKLLLSIIIVKFLT